MTIKSKELVAGGFVLGGIIGFFIIVSVLGGFFQKTDTYYTSVANVAGLKKGAAVIYEGYIIGSVSGITPMARPEGMTFLIDLDVQKGWRIPQTSEAGIASLSLLSAMAIQIKAGTGPALNPGDIITTSEKANFVDELTRTADNFAKIAEENLVPLLNTMDNLLSNHGAATLGNISILTESLAAELPKIAANLNHSTERLNALIASVDPETIRNNINDIDQIIGNTLTASGKVNTALDTINAETLTQVMILLTETKTTIGELNTILTTSSGAVEGIVADIGEAASRSKDLTQNSTDQILTILSRLDRAALNIEEMTAILRNNPSVLITGTE
jgi:phospholipid/cholesterol/gamma-HCH transport system substrate-binding protein